MGKLFPKITKFSFLIGVILLVIGACLVEPVDINEFLEDEAVQDIIEKAKGMVVLSTDSDTGLIAGHSKISRLAAGNYYKIERQNEDQISYTFLGYIRSNGSRSGSLTEIGRITEGAEITDLTNDVVYRVVSAKPTGKTITYTPSAGAGGSIIPDNGVITITPPTVVTYTIDFPADYYGYQKVKISPPAANSVIADNAASILMGVNESADIIFYDDTSKDFWFLRIVIKPLPAINITLGPYALPAQIPVNITNVANINISGFEGHICDGSPCFTLASHTRTIAINNAANLGSTYNITSFNWFHGSTQIDPSTMDGFTIQSPGGSGSSQLIIDFTGDYLYNEQLNREGVHIYSVTAQDSSGRPWSAIFSITVTNN